MTGGAGGAQGKQGGWEIAMDLATEEQIVNQGV
jgi:hypothetical protein